ncbi:nitroreductase family protein [Mobilitalea sibirica]|uniref:Nitroreductase family protein n=1 Tax=Mobilitalea sibirica TaxID=1462919 RepID=A0A8J7H2T8_9FIRM|nr:nitroreductase family protein [Mobilitalea sibirica]MBH1941203.1 nitroreductase family protein [Mobilitalea sibirica]
MDLYTAINQRRTIRDFEEKEVPIEIIKKLIQAGLKAPTNDHMRNWEFVIIGDKDERAKVLDKIPKKISGKKVEGILESWNMTDPCQRAMYLDAIPKQYSMLYRCGCLVLPFFKQDHPLLKPESLSSLNSFASIWCCIENILLAAAAEGLYVALRIPFDKESVYLKNVIGHPDNYIMPCYLAIGYPSENAAKYDQYEYDAEDKIHINRW